MACGYGSRSRTLIRPPTSQRAGSLRRVLHQSQPKRAAPTRRLPSSPRRLPGNPAVYRNYYCDDRGDGAGAVRQIDADDGKRPDLDRMVAASVRAYANLANEMLEARHAEAERLVQLMSREIGLESVEFAERPWVGADARDWR